MVRKCYVCKRAYEKESSRSYHKFPKEEIKRHQWFEVFGLEPVKDKTAFLCSDHFSIDHFCTQLNGRKVLRKNAFPKALDPEPSISNNTSTQMYECLEQKVAFEEVFDPEPSTPSTQMYECEEQKVTFEELSQIKVNTVAMDPLFKPSVSRMKQYATSSSSCSSSQSLPRNISTIKQLPSEYTKSQKGSTTETCSSEEVPILQGRKRKNKRFTVPRYVGDIDNDEIVTPAEAKRNIMLAKNKIMQQRKKIRYLQQQHRRSKIKIGTLQMLLDHLTNNKTEDSELTINASASSENIAIARRLLKGKAGEKYSPEFRAFAVTLHFYSPQAYEYVRDTFNKSLPHPSIITKWHSLLNVSPSFTEESLCIKDEIN